MRKMLLFFVAILATGALTQLFSQDKKAGDEVIKVDTQLVEVPVVVTDGSGKPILNLKQNNFTIYEDGKKQELTEFSSATAPFEVALLLDTSGSTRGDLQLIQRAAQEFLASLRPGDRVAIVSFNTERSDKRAFPGVEILSGLTDDRKVLKDAINTVKTSNGTPYYDSLVDIAAKVFHDAPTEEFRGRRALVALTDGVDSTSSNEFRDARDRLQAGGVISFFVKVDTRSFFEENLLGDCAVATQFSQAQIRRYYRMFANSSKMEKAASFCDLGDFERLDISKRLYELADTEMDDLAKASGGKVFPVGDLNEARNAFKSVANEIGTKYSLGYYPTNEKKDGTFRKISVELKSVPAGTLVKAREGYSAPAN